MNLAIVLSVSDYINENQLPSGKNDALLMSEILEHTSKYEEILVLDESRESELEKESLINFVEKYKGKEINEVFFYFSGHGSFDGSQFYYLLADYDRRSRKQTSLENSELDDLLRSLKPNLAVKIIDSCQSGIGYVKEENNLDQYIKNANQEFSNCYFMFSSQSNQSSYADKNISHFTREFAQSIVARRNENIRYKDIANYISDMFENVNEQKPFFVSQGGNTDVFCIKSDDLDKKIRDLLDKFGVSNSLVTQGTSSGSLIERIKADAKNYCSKEETIEVLEKLKTTLFAKKIEGEVGELYDLEWNEQKGYKNIVDFNAIGNWIKDNKDNYFVEHTSTTKKVEYANNQFGILSANLNRALGTDTINVVTGAYSTVDLPFNQLSLSATPKHPNIQKTSLAIIPFLSQTMLLIFYAFINYEKTDWGETFSPQKTKWLVREIPLRKDKEIETFCEFITTSFKDFTLQPLVERFDTVESEIIVTEENREAVKQLTE